MDDPVMPGWEMPRSGELLDGWDMSLPGLPGCLEIKPEAEHRVQIELPGGHFAAA